MQETVKKAKAKTSKLYQILDLADCIIDTCKDPSLSKARRTMRQAKKVIQ